jgi:hypothetical protein
VSGAALEPLARYPGRIELQSETDKGDADTLARTTDYGLYIRSVSGPSVDVKSTITGISLLPPWTETEKTCGSLGPASVRPRAGETSTPSREDVYFATDGATRR